MAGLEAERSRLSKFKEALLDQFSEGARSGILGEAALGGSVAN